MEVIKSKIPGCVEVIPRVFADERGKLVKIYHEDIFRDLGLRTDFKEVYYSVSGKGVLRGLHFQVPPHQHVKCVTCLSGKLFDVVVDLRVGSPSYGEHACFELDAERSNVVYVPEGCAHGFYALTDQAVFLNRSTTVFHAESDKGIRWDSCEISWPDLHPVLSVKDKELPGLEEFASPFVFEPTPKS